MDEFLKVTRMFIHPLMGSSLENLQTNNTVIEQSNNIENNDNENSSSNNNESLVYNYNYLERKKIKILTYNLFLRPPPVKTNEDDWKDERLLDFISEMDNFDIICLQEVFATFTNRKYEIIRLANKAGFFFYCDSPIPSFYSKFTIDGGLLILSRFPILDHEFIPYEYGVLSDALAYKGILSAKIDINGSELLVINTHTQASYFDVSQEYWDISSETRINQLNQLKVYIEEIFSYKRKIKVESNCLCLIVGDLNVDALNYNYIRSTKGFWDTIDEYDFFIDDLSSLGKVSDIYYDTNKIHPITFGEKLENNGDKVLTHSTDVGTCLSLDYIISIYPKRELFTDESSKRILKVVNDKDSVNVERFLIDKKPYTQLSDHYGLSIELEL